jgi:hypothetical protein
MKYYEYSTENNIITKEHMNKLRCAIINHSDIKQNFYHLELNCNIINVYFTEKLSDELKCKLDEIINKYILKNRNHQMSQMSISRYCCPTNIYKTICTFIHPCDKLIIDKIWFIANIADDLNIENPFYNVKIYNVTENKIIAEQTFNNINEKILKFHNIKICSNEESIIDMQIKTNCGIIVKTLFIYYR